MPYITDEEKEKFMSQIAGLVDLIRSKGDLNFVISEITGQLILRDGASYTITSNWIGGVRDADRELTRRLLNPYEDIKIRENGDVPSFRRIINTYKE